MSEKSKLILVRFCFMGLMPIVSVIHMMLNVYRDNVHSIKILLDDRIPFVPLFSVPYLYWFIYVLIGLFYFALKDGKTYFRLLGSIVMGMSICFVIFYFFPTTVSRPVIEDRTVFEKIVGIIYSVDNPYNCFPSIHVLDAMLVTLFFCKHSNTLMVRYGSILSCIAIILSTLFIKQHFILDAIAAIIISVAVYLLFTSEQLWGCGIVQKAVKLVSPVGVKESPDSI